MSTSATTYHPLRRRSAAVTFAKHYLEMVVAMFVGMFVLGGAAATLLGLAGVDLSDWHTDAPALMLLWMATTMTVPMAAWMRLRGHGWAATAEMSASMYLPTFLAIALLAAGAVEGHGTLMAIQHVVMFPAMLAAMLLRPAEYAGHH